MRDSNGWWIVGYQRYVGKGSALNAELWAILHEIDIAKQRGYKNVVVESNCLVAVEMLKDSSNGTLVNTIIRRIKEVANHFGVLEIQFIRCEGNLVVDYLAKSSDTSESIIRITETPNSYVNKLLFDEIVSNHNV